MRPFLAVLLVLSSLLLTACTTQRSALKSASSYQVGAPKEDFVFERSRAMVVLRAGQYDPAGQDDSGVWYAGKPENLLIIYLDSPKNRIDGKLATAVYTGGVFVPHDKTKSASGEREVLDH